ncbi:CorA family divalent cation transporter, partial [Pseudoalteromonas carrageenovora]|uniref:CorA family divalent cation transporter n=1 Tax=Pseudoalteromonas carrageenovora TaxID=227 RepID=UPI00311FD5B5
SISELVCTITHKLTYRMHTGIDSLDETLDEFDEEIDEPSKKIDIQGLSQLRRLTIALKRYLKPQKDALS